MRGLDERCLVDGLCQDGIAILERLLGQRNVIHGRGYHEDVQGRYSFQQQSIRQFHLEESKKCLALVLAEKAHCVTYDITGSKRVGRRYDQIRCDAEEDVEYSGRLDFRIGEGDFLPLTAYLEGGLEDAAVNQRRLTAELTWASATKLNRF